MPELNSMIKSYFTLNGAVMEVGEEIKRITILTNVIYFSTDHEAHLLRQVKFYHDLNQLDRARQVVRLVAGAKYIQDECKAIRDNGFSNINKMSFIALFSILESALEDSFSELLVGAVPEIIKQGLLTPREAKRDPDAGELYIAVKRNALKLGGFSEAHVAIGVCVGLELQISEELRRSVNEMKELRNCLLHNAGVVDKKLAERSRVWEKRVGDKIVIEVEYFKKIMDDMIEFIKCLTRGFHEALGFD